MPAIVGEPRFVASWDPLARVLGGRGKVGIFMYMASYSLSNRTIVHTYKHIETRGYLNVDDEGRCYRYDGETSAYVPIERAEAIEKAFSF